MAKRIPADFRVPSEPGRGLKKVEKRVLDELASAGLVTRGKGAPSTFKPLRVAEKPVTDTLLEDRNDRL
jgi:hypothetical protein